MLMLVLMPALVPALVGLVVVGGSVRESCDRDLPVAALHHGGSVVVVLVLLVLVVGLVQWQHGEELGRIVPFVVQHWDRVRAA